MWDKAETGGNLQKIKRGTFPFYKFCLGKTLISLNAHFFSVAVNKVVTIPTLWSFQILYHMYYNFLLTNITFIVLGLEKEFKTSIVLPLKIY